MNRPLRRLSLTVLIVISSLLGIIVGTGVAYADLVSHNLSVGTYDYYSTLVDNQGTGEEWSYIAKQRITMSADKTDVTFETGTNPNKSTYYYSGDSNDPNNIVFGALYIYDEYGYHSEYYDNFLETPIDGVDYYSATSWTYGNMTATNNYVIHDQNIWKWTGSGWTSLGVDYISYKTQ